MDIIQKTHVSTRPWNIRSVRATNRLVIVIKYGDPITVKVLVYHCTWVSVKGDSWRRAHCRIRPILQDSVDNPPVLLLFRPTDPKLVLCWSSRSDTGGTSRPLKHQSNTSVPLMGFHFLHLPSMCFSSLSSAVLLPSDSSVWRLNIFQREGSFCWGKVFKGDKTLVTVPL